VDRQGWHSTPVPATRWQYALREDQAIPTRSFDVVILGGGNAGMGVTVATRETGLKVAMLEPDLLGGTCPNRGRMPKKVLVAAAHALDEIGVPKRTTSRSASRASTGRR
jgi:pyruvate/2-oxoglutarate dehydrogenase complex dihydrolipoamide dehydrogenase (E3) component